MLSAPVPDLDLPPDYPVVAESSDLLTADWLLHGRRAQPAPGWRRTVYRATGGLVKISESSAGLRRREMVNRVRTPVAGGHHRVAVMSLKGGVGKTTTAVGLGATLASAARRPGDRHGRQPRPGHPVGQGAAGKRGDRAGPAERP